MPIIKKNNDEEQEMQEQEIETGSNSTIPSELPILPLKGVVVYPLTVLPLNVGQARSLRLVDDVVKETNRLIGLVTIKTDKFEDAGPDDLYEIGTAAVIHRMLRAPDGTVRLIVQGMERIRIKEFTSLEPYLKANIELAPETIDKSVEVEALTRNTVELFRTLVSLSQTLPEELLMAALNVEDPRQLVYMIATSMRIDLKQAQELLELNDVQEKLVKLDALLTKEVEVLELGKKISGQAQQEIEKNQREYILREQLKQIQKELGEGSEQEAEITSYDKKISEAGMPEEAEKEARRELDRMKTMPPAAAEYHVIKTYLDWLTDLPWNVTTEDNLDIPNARKILDEDHYDLKDIKDRILEYLAVRKLRAERLRSEEREGEEGQESRTYRGSILTLVGPPGVGKTSLGQSVARALGRKFIRMSLGGMHDEAEIRGHRRTYIGAMPGRLIQSIKRAGTKNPVIMLDEVDKVGADYRGDPSSALLEVLDPAQNKTFRDHYLDVDFDLSQVIFICTANTLETISPPLRDRMEILPLSGYTDYEKTQIAKGYLIPRQLKDNGLEREEVTFDEEAIRTIIRDYTREAGVRNLEREVGRVARKLATKVAEGEQPPFDVTPEMVRQLLGKARFYNEVRERTETPGVATGLAWTPVGGDILFIEATRMPGGKGFLVTGQLGDVMKESSQAAYSYVRSKSKELGIEPETIEKSDIHLHIPEGATPKDGPSAGVTMATALASLLTNRRVKDNIAMTGEITLRGRVLPVGGIKEKVLAAHRAGLDTVILPNRNERDLDDLPEEIRKDLKFVLAERVEDVWNAALEAKPIPAEMNGHGNHEAERQVTNSLN
ncbi:MAG: endopeptidase La [Chloroflexota bacterium]|nr:MAG: endopeptidase La [Chloroflexota bacterium]